MVNHRRILGSRPPIETNRFRFHGPEGFEADYKGLMNYFQSVRAGFDDRSIALRQGKLSGFSVERLMRFLLLLGRDIDITVRGRSKSRAAARLRVA